MLFNVSGGGIMRSTFTTVVYPDMFNMLLMPHLGNPAVPVSGRFVSS